jgi:Ca2+/H+ antiporter
VSRSPAPAVEVERLHEVRRSAVLVRFVFGFVISAAAALVSMRLGHHIGGLFLAFPAILPASLTLIELRHGDTEASVNAMGASIGGGALIGFALVAASLLPRLQPLVAIVLATAAWLVLATTFYFAVAAIRGRLGETPAPR